MTAIAETAVGMVILIGVAGITGYGWEWWQFWSAAGVGLFARIIAP